MPVDLFQPFLVNPLTEDPALFIKITNQKRALLVDCGDISRLSTKNLQIIGQIFISHTHIDHFIGFDNIIRANIGLNKTIHVFGPPGISRQVHCKLLAYTWNLLSEEHLNVVVSEIEIDRVTEYAYFSRDRFEQGHLLRQSDLENRTIYRDPFFKVDCVRANHIIPCLAYSFTEHDGWRVDKQKLKDFQHLPGPWLRELIDRLLLRSPLEFEIFISGERYSLAELKHRLLEPKKGQKLTYVTDTIYSPQTEEIIVELARDSDIFFCEAHFLEEDYERARESYHLTAKQAGLLAQKSGVQKVIGFHYSPRYRPDQGYCLNKQLQETLRNKE